MGTGCTHLDCPDFRPDPDEPTPIFDGTPRPKTPLERIQFEKDWDARVQAGKKRKKLP